MERLDEFQELYDAICNTLRQKGIVDTFIRDFSQLASNEERIQRVMSMKHLPPFVLEESYNPKDIWKMRELLETSSRSSLPENQRLQMLDEAIANSPSEDPEGAPVESQNWQKPLSLALQRKAEILYSRGDIGAALKCVDESLKLKLSLVANEVSKPIQLLRAKCQLHLTGQVEDSCPKDLVELAKCEVKQERTDQRRKTGKRGNERRKHLPKLFLGHNMNIPFASEAVSLHEEPGRGRCLKANRDIAPGDVLIQEIPFSSILSTDATADHCSYCHDRLSYFVSCHRCATARYCSENCKKEAWYAFHRYECPVYFHIRAPGLGVMSSLTYTTICRAGFENILSESPPTSFQRVLSMVTHTKDRPTGDLFKRSLMAIFLSTCLELSGFIPPQTSTEKKVKVAATILQLSQNLPCNAYEVTELQYSPSNIRQAEVEAIGGAVCPTVALTNHSCDPNIHRSFIGSTCIVRACRPISANEEILDNYGYFYHSSPLPYRKKELQERYFFNCLCKACTENWSSISDLPILSWKVQCPGCKTEIRSPNNGQLKLTPCHSCGLGENQAPPPAPAAARGGGRGRRGKKKGHRRPQPQQQPQQNVEANKQCEELRMIEKDIQTNTAGATEAKELLIKGHWEQAYPKLLKHVQTMDKFGNKPCKEDLESQLLLKYCFSRMANAVPIATAESNT